MTLEFLYLHEHTHKASFEKQCSQVFSLNVG